MIAENSDSALSIPAEMDPVCRRLTNIEILVGKTAIVGRETPSGIKTACAHPDSLKNEIVRTNSNDWERFGIYQERIIQPIDGIR